MNLKNLALLSAAMIAGCATVEEAPVKKYVKPDSPSCRASKMPFKLGIAGYTYHQKSIDEALAAMKRMDVHYLCVKDFHFNYLADKTDEEIAAFKDKCASFGVECLAAGPQYFKDEATARKLFEFAKRYGMKTVVVVPYGVEKGKPDEWGPQRYESEEMLDVLDKLVKEFDIKAAIHNHGPDLKTLFPTAESALARIGNRDKRIGVCLDIGHERRSGMDPVAFIRKHADRIYDVHVKNIKIDPVANFAKEGPRGELDIAGVFKALAEAGYDGCCHLEYEKDFQDNLAEVAETIGYLRGVMDTIHIAPKMQPVPADANTLSAAEKADGFELLFDGKNLPTNNFVGVKNGCKEFPKKGWFVKEGALTMRPLNGIANGEWFPLPPEDQKLGGGGDIVTVKKYRNFIFKFDFRLTEAANSGVKYYFDEALDNATCEEYQVLDPAHPDSTKGKNGNRRVAALYDLIPANAEKFVKPLGAWNSGMVVAKDNKIEHWLNGVKVLEYVRGSEAFRKAVKASKYADWGKSADGKPQNWGENPEGRLLLQDHTDSTVSFCNLKVKSL